MRIAISNRKFRNYSIDFNIQTLKLLKRSGKMTDGVGRLEM